MGGKTPGKRRGRPPLYHTQEERHEAILLSKRKDYARHRQQRCTKMREYYDVQAESANRQRRAPKPQELSPTSSSDDAATSSILRDAHASQGVVRALLGCRRIPVWAKEVVLTAREVPAAEAQLVLDGITKTLEDENRVMEDLTYRMFIGKYVPQEDARMHDLDAILRYVKCSLNAITDIAYAHKDGTLELRYTAGQCYFQTYDFE